MTRSSSLGAAVRQFMRKAKTGHPITFKDAYDICPYRTLIGMPPCTVESLTERVGGALALVENVSPEPLRASEVAELVRTIATGRSVLLVAMRADTRDYARAQIIMAAGHLGNIGAA